MAGGLQKKKREEKGVPKAPLPGKKKKRAAKPGKVKSNY